MSKVKTAPSAEPVTNGDLADAIHAIAQATRAQADSATQIMRMMQEMAAMMQQVAAGGPAAGMGGTATATATQINIWADDPFSEDNPTTNPPLAATLAVGVPTNNNALLQTKITEPAVAAGQYQPGTADYRFWVASEALARGINFWAPLLPSGTRWKTTATPMRVGLVSGQDLNAFYSRTAGLRFFQQVVRSVVISSAESADVVCHELGHAILDAIRPQLFDAASHEAAAFHESFGDMSGILCALQLPTVRQEVLAETQGRLNTNSRLSRLAEQLGWGIRQLSPSAVDRDCLRNAANRFFYRPPQSLPPSAPATQLSSEAHSFSRVFTGAFLDALARMLLVAGPASEAGLLAISRDMGRLLVAGVRAATITPAYFSQVAAAMIEADRALFQGRYRTSLSTAFVQHGILSLNATAEMLLAPASRAMVGSDGANGSGADAAHSGDGPHDLGLDDDDHTRTGADAPTLPTRTLSMPFGMAIEVHAPVDRPRFAVTPAIIGVQGDRRTPDDDAAAFMENLILLGRVNMGQAMGVAGAVAMDLAPPEEDSRVTHTMVAGPDGTMALKRLHFDCGFCG